MFRRHLQLPAYMVFTQFFQESLVFIFQQIIKPDSGTDEYFSDLRQFPQCPQDVHIFRVLCIQILARLRKKALLIRAYPVFQLFLAGRMAEVRSRSAYIMNIPLKSRLLRAQFCLLNQRFLTSCLNDTPLMKGECTEITAAETATVAYQAELNLFYRRNASRLSVRRMIRPHIRQCIHIIHLHLTQWLRRWVLHDIQVLGIWLHQPFSGIRIGIAVLGVKAFCISLFLFL